MQDNEDDVCPCAQCRGSPADRPEVPREPHEVQLVSPL